MAHPERSCIACPAVDDHPRHSIYLGPGQVANWHMDCHVKATGCEECTSQLADAGGATGDQLRTHLISLTPKD